jgi:hypothetical protein
VLESCPKSGSFCLLSRCTPIRGPGSLRIKVRVVHCSFGVAPFVIVELDGLSAVRECF